LRGLARAGLRHRALGHVRDPVQQPDDHHQQQQGAQRAAPSEGDARGLGAAEGERGRVHEGCPDDDRRWRAGDQRQGL
jgi:hypothetical protein